MHFRSGSGFGRGCNSNKTGYIVKALIEKERLLRSTMLAGFAAVGLGIAPAYAQDAETVPADDEAQPAAEDTIVITGSRIARTDVEAVYPTIAVDASALERSAFTNIAEALNEIPAFGNGVSTDGDAGQVGANFADFLDLGTARTLTLVNGRRFVSQNVGANGQQVDFGIIPLALVERIDTIGVGGAPIYGSDAIAGTINVILKDDFEGMELTTQYGISEESDLEEYTVQLVAGANFADGRGNVTFSAEYFNQEGLMETDRPDHNIFDIFLSEVPAGTAGFNDIDIDGDGTPDDVFRAFNLDGSSPQDVQLFTPGGVVSPGTTFIPTFGLGSVGGDFLQFSPTGELVPFNVGESIPGTSAFFAQGGETYGFFANRTQLRSPLERIVFTSSFTYDITPDVRAFGEVMTANLVSEDLADQSGFQTFAFTGTSRPLLFSVDHPLLSSQARTTLTDAGLSQFYVSRTLDDLLLNSGGETETNVWRFVGGLQGDFEFADRNFSWEVSGNAGHTTNKSFANSLIDQNFLYALDAVEMTDAIRASITAAGGDADTVGQTGDIVCQISIDSATGAHTGVSGNGVTDNDLPFAAGCVPINIFGEGAASQEAIDYVTAISVANNDIEQSVFNANFSGELFELPAGWMQFAVGYETRKEYARLQPGGFRELGLGRSSAVPANGGTYTTQEFFGEIFVPVISDDMNIPLVNRLQFEGSARSIDNSQAGEFTAWTVGGQYSPIGDLTFRANMTESLRAPSLSELFTPIVSTFEFADDPCDRRFINDDPNYAPNCIAAGVNVDANGDGQFDFVSNVVNATARGRTGGNPNLANETAESYSIGFVYQPSFNNFVDGMTLQADYINIEIADAIGSLSLEQLMQTCFGAEAGSFPNAACSAFTRDSGGQVVDFLSGLTNSDSYSTEFFNARFDWGFDVGEMLRLDGGTDYGFLNFDAQVFHVITREEVVAQVTQNNTIGGFGDPEWSGTLDFTWDRDALRVFWRARWQDESLFSPSGNNTFAGPDDVIKRETDDWYWMHSMSVAYDVGTLTDITDNPVLLQLTVDNVFGRDGLDLESQAFGQFGFDDVFGRRYSLRLRTSF